jgi:uncharacterized protein
MSVVSTYTAVLVVLFVVLSIRVVRLRGRLGVAIGDGGNGQLLRAVRVHSNFAEYVPIAVLSMYFAELAAAPPFLVHVLCACLVFGRVSHAYGVSQASEAMPFRVVGMILTFTALLGSAGYILRASL